MKANPIRSRLGRTLAVVVAGSVVGVTGALMAAADERPSRPDHHQADREAIAEWAEANDLTGLSPASMSRVNLDARVVTRMAAEYREIAEFARREGISGLSPAWMATIDD